MTRMAWLLFCLAAVSAFDPGDYPTYEIEKYDTVTLISGQKIIIRHTTDVDEEASWVLGRFQSELCYPEEGKFGDRYKDKEYPGRPWVQFWTMICNNASPGTSVRLEFWYIQPLDAEMYFNDYQAYIAKNGSHPRIKFITVQVERSGEL